MQQKNSPHNFFGDVQSTWQQALETTRKNFQAINEANQRAVQGWQTLAQRQTEMVSQFLQDNAVPSFTQSTTEEKLAKQADIFQSVYQRSIANTQELAELATKCTKDAAEVISKRVVASMDEIKSASGSDQE